MAIDYSAFVLDGMVTATGQAPVAPGWHTVPAYLTRDFQSGGSYRISGTVTEVGSPDHPVARRVRLHRQRDGVLVGEVWSGQDGSYAFNGIENQAYYVVALDHTHNQNAVIKSDITPEAM